MVEFCPRSRHGRNGDFPQDRLGLLIGVAVLAVIGITLIALVSANRQANGYPRPSAQSRESSWHPL